MAKQSGNNRKRLIRKIAAHAAFKEGLKRGETLTALCKRLNIHKNTATEWLKGVRMEIVEALDARGLNAHTVAEKIERLLEAQTVRWNPATEEWDVFADGRLQLDTIVAMAKLRAMFPAIKQEPPFEPVTVVIRDVIPATGGEVVAARARSNFHNTGREILQASGAPEIKPVETEIEAGNPDWE